MIILYQFPTSPFAEKVRRILHFKGLAFDIVNVPRAEVQRFSHISASGKFPAIDHDGAAVQDSTAIAHHIEQHFPDPPLIPQGSRDAALAHVIEDWADESLYFYELVMRLGWRHNAVHAAPAFAATMPGLSNEEVLERLGQGVEAITRPQGLGRKTPEEIVADVHRHLLSLDAMLRGHEWLVGSALSLADIAVTSQLRALLGAEEVVRIAETLPAVTDWEERVSRLAPP